jgi:hypothetical protein
MLPDTRAATSNCSCVPKHTRMQRDVKPIGIDPKVTVYHYCDFEFVFPFSELDVRHMPTWWKNISLDEVIRLITDILLVVK